MTAPNFGSITPAQLVQTPQPRSNFGETAQLLMAIMQGREQLAMRRQELELERQRTEASIAEGAERTAGAKEERKRAQIEFEQKQMDLEARDIVATAMGGLTTVPGGITPEAIEKLRVDLIQKHKKHAPWISAAVTQQARGIDEMRAAIAQRRTEEVRADVAEKTKQDEIEAKKLGVDNARLAIEINQQQKRMNAMELAYPGSRTAQAVQAWQQGGEPFGKYRKLFGVPAIAGGIGDTEVFVDGSATGSGTAQRTAEATGTQILLANTLINNAAVKPTLWTKLRISSGQGTFGRFLDEALAAGSSPEQQQLAQGALLFGAAFGRWVSGQASSEREAQRLANIIIEPSSADDATRAQYRAVRESITQIIVQSSQGQLTPTIAADLVTEQLGKLQLSPAQRKELEKIKADAARYEKTGKLVGTPSPRDSVVPKSQAEIQLQGYGITIAPRAP